MRRFVIATTLLICLSLAPHARAAGAPRGFYGVIAANDPDSTEIARMGTGKVGTLRINFVWGAVQPRQGAPYDWSHYDAIIGAAAQQGIRVLPTVYSSPAWVATKTNYPPPESRMGDFQAFVRAAAERYGSQRHLLVVAPVYSQASGDRLAALERGQLAELLVLEAEPEAVRGPPAGVPRRHQDRRPSAKIVLAGLFRTPQVKHGIPLDRYLPAIYRRKGPSRCSTPSPSTPIRRLRGTP